MIGFRIFLTAILLIAFQTNNAQEVCAENNTESAPKKEVITVARYCYYPNIEAYYDIVNNFYIFKENGEWTTAQEIPNGYRGYSVMNKINIKIYDYDGETPQEMLPIHKIKHPYVINGRMKQPIASED